MSADIRQLIETCEKPVENSREFAKFAHDWEFEHNTSSPGNSKANGKAESAVKTAKNLMKKSLEAGTDLYTAILDYRNTPTQGLETSPAQRLMNRRTKTLLPTTKRLLQPRVYYADKEQSQLKQRQERQRAIYDKNARDLPPLCEGDTVRMKPFGPGERMWRKAIVTEKLDDRSYYVENQDGGTYRRNRQHLNKSREQPPPTDRRQAHISTAEQAPNPSGNADKQN
ncbi:hypothetical protein QZH41_007217, partial [Actinostola sp. cb2023]